RADGWHLVTIEQIARRLRSSIQRMNAPKLIGRYGALLPLFRLVGVHCITAFVESGQPTASPQRSPETRGLIPDPIVAGIAGLLHARHERPRRRAAEQRDEREALYIHVHSTTSSARPSSVSGTVRPNALAVLRLTISSTLVDCWTGRSPARSPLRIRPA